jgi:hypothetical protein
VQKPTMVWNTQMKYWEHSTESQLLELSVPFLGTWQTSGTMLDGQVYELVMPVPHTKDSEYSSLPTPTVSDQYTANLASTQQKEGSMHSVTLAQVFHKIELFMTPVATEGTKAPSQQTSKTKSKTGQVWLSNQAKDISLLPTATAIQSRNATSGRQLGSKHHSGTTLHDVAYLGSWGKFERAIRRWESIIGRQAPEPTKPDGKDGNHRLSSKFTEWMMGLPDGWITDIGLKRNDELKACGNGVVPQQAELALSLLGIKEILERN